MFLFFMVFKDVVFVEDKLEVYGTAQYAEAAAVLTLTVYAESGRLVNKIYTCMSVFLPG